MIVAESHIADWVEPEYDLKAADKDLQDREAADPAFKEKMDALRAKAASVTPK